MTRAIITAAFALTVCSAGYSQVAPGADTVHLQTTIGSFKLIDGEGTVSFSFEGTVLLINVKGDIKPEGNLRKEFDEPKMNRVAYFGKGKLTIKGSWHGIQWFGTNMTGTIKGSSIVRIVGEFDKDLNTGTYWFDDDPTTKNPWYTSGYQFVVPKPARNSNKPVRRGSGG